MATKQPEKRPADPSGEEKLDELYQVVEKAASAEAVEALAAWYDAQGSRNAAECLRWTIAQNKRPFLYRTKDKIITHSHPDWGEGYYWWVSETPADQDDWGQPDECKLPDVLWSFLKHHFGYEPVLFKEYPTRRAAFEALIAVWPIAMSEEWRERWQRGRDASTRLTQEPNERPGQVTDLSG